MDKKSSKTRLKNISSILHGFMVKYVPVELRLVVNPDDYPYENFWAGRCPECGCTVDSNTNRICSGCNIKLAWPKEVK